MCFELHKALKLDKIKSYGFRTESIFNSYNKATVKILQKIQG